MKRALPFVFLLAGTLGSAALIMSKPEREPLASEERAWTVETVPVHRRSISPEILLYGRTASPSVSELSAAMEADVVEVPAREGAQVEAGALLVRLDDRDIGLALEEQTAGLAEIEAQLRAEALRHDNDRRALARETRMLDIARLEVTRAENLAKSNAGSRARLDEARQAAERQALAVDARRYAIREYESRRQQLEARLARARAVRDRTRLDLERTRVRAPFGGRVTRVDVSPGDRVRPGTPLVEIYDNSRMEIRAELPARAVGEIRATLAAGTRLPARALVDGVEIVAALERLTGRVERGSGGVDGIFVVSSGGRWLPLGKTVEVTLELPAVPDVVAVPFEALYGTDRIYVVSDGRMKSVAVERHGVVGARSATPAVLVSGTALAEGDAVIATQLPNAIDGLRIRVAPSTARP